MNNTPQRTLLQETLAEAIGTGLLVFFGVGSVHVAVFTDGLVGLWQVAAVWGLGIGLAIYATGAISGAHLNPAVSVALTVFRGFSPRKLVPYVAAQVSGVFVAAAILYMLFHPLIARFESKHALIRGQAGSERSAMAYGEYFPNPGMIGVTPESFATVSLPMAMAAEAIGTALLVMFIFVLTDQRNENRPARGGVAFCIGVTVSAIICIIAPLTQAGLNPARDFGPRLFAWLTGWGAIAIPGPRGGFFMVYILAPIIGGLIGGAIYDLFLRPALSRMHHIPDVPDASGEQTPPVRTGRPMRAEPKPISHARSSS